MTIDHISDRTIVAVSLPLGVFGFTWIGASLLLPFDVLPQLRLNSKLNPRMPLAKQVDRDRRVLSTEFRIVGFVSLGCAAFCIYATARILLNSFL